MAYRDPPFIPVPDPTLRAALDELRRAIIELARDHRFRDATVVLPNATAVPVKHGLMRPLIAYALGAPTGALAVGCIEEVSRTSDTITFEANGFGATISVPVRFW